MFTFVKLYFGPSWIFLMVNTENLYIVDARTCDAKISVCLARSVRKTMIHTLKSVYPTTVMMIDVQYTGSQQYIIANQT